MFNRYFQQELSYLKELGAEFAEAHPAVAPMLSGPSSDPDVERLLEGVAFLTAQIREKLDDEFPEIIHELIQLIWPHYLRPVPSCSIVCFTPKPALKQPLTVKAGTQVASVPVEGSVCLFQTCYDTDIHPLAVTEAAYLEPAGKPACIRLQFALKGLTLGAWQPQRLRFYLDGSYAEATALYLLLRTTIRRVVISAADDRVLLVLGPQHIKPVGFSAEQSVIPYPTNAFPAYRIVQEYFVVPQKFLFVDLEGVERWEGAGADSSFQIDFELTAPPPVRPRLKVDSFRLFATPVVNLFPFDADPIRVDHRQSEYLVRPASSQLHHYQVYSVEEVVGRIQGSAREKVYRHFNCFSPESRRESVYQLSLKNSPVRRGADTYLQLSYPPEGALPVTETLSLKLLCTNGDLPESLRLGDICRATSSSPEFADFKNIMQPTLGVYPPLGKNLLWRLLAHLNLNTVSLATPENLKALLGLYLFSDTRDRSGLLANQKRLQSIEQLTSKPANRLISALVLRGRDITLGARSDHFAGAGDFYLFGCIIDEFLALYASINAFSRFTMTDLLKGESYQWPARTGTQPLI